MENHEVMHIGAGNEGCFHLAAAIPAKYNPNEIVEFLPP
jgi:hypothetical protein